MTNHPPENQDNETWEDNVEKKEKRKIRARREKDQSVWFGLGMFGMVGWSIAIPTLLGIFLGIWIDNTWPSRFSWTLMLLFAGLIIGCMNAWKWVNTESGTEKQSRRKEKKDD